MCNEATYLLPSLVTALAMVLFSIVTRMVGVARGRYKIAVPATTGHPDFERYYRVQANTLEQMILFLPSLWLCAAYLSPEGAGALGFDWARALCARLLYRGQKTCGRFCDWPNCFRIVAGGWISGHHSTIYWIESYKDLCFCYDNVIAKIFSRQHVRLNQLHQVSQCG
jgi:hypothetical protein